jgi:hypothetical protein
MISQVVLIIFWLLVAGVMVLPLRMSLLLFLVLCHMDPSGQAFASATSVGFGNLVKGVVLPILLLLRSGPDVLRWSSWPLALKLWTALCVQAALGAVFGAYHIAAMKMTAYLAAYAIVFLIFCSAWHTRKISRSDVDGIVWIGLLLGVLQTYLLGNAFGGEESRFTSFSSPQSYAAFMMYCTALAALARERWTLGAVLTVAAGFVSIVLSGSRYVLAGLAVFVVSVLMTRVMMARTARRRLRRLITSVVLLALATGGVVAAGYAFSVERLTSFLAADQRTSSGGTALGTFLWRVSIYQYALTELSHRDPLLLLVGTGTSSAGRIFTKVNPSVQDAEIDANRIMHNELLRTLYEWGILGLLILVAVIILTGSYFLLRFREFGSAYTLAALLALPTALLGLAIENVLSGAVMPNGVGLSLLLSAAWTVEATRGVRRANPAWQIAPIGDSAAANPA